MIEYCFILDLPTHEHIDLEGFSDVREATWRVAENGCILAFASVCNNTILLYNRRVHHDNKQCFNIFPTTRYEAWATTATTLADNPDLALEHNSVTLINIHGKVV